MLQFICKGWENARGCRIFKNISCYSLSMQGEIDKLNQQNLKTSHVTVYLHPMQLPFGINPYLKTSHVTVYPDPEKSAPDPEAFKNISCYSLSGENLYGRIDSFYLKTSHVTVYQ